MQYKTMQYGDWVLLQDRKARKYLFRLRQGGSFDTQRGAISHSSLVQALPGEQLATPQGEPYWLYLPTLEDYVLFMPREATPTYPKDAAAMCALLDLKPGLQVVEAGSGSGGLTLYLARAVGPSGRVLSYDSRPKHQQRAKANLEAFENWGNVTWVAGDLAQAGGLPALDGVALDVTEPWNVLPAITPALKAGCFVVAYLPNLTQVLALVEHLKDLPYTYRTLEVQHRYWDIRPPTAHPHFQQVGHTAFLVQLRKTL
jgi:tRNA (adenine57-N1/adenine58-N1)-methyltransferase catalytic subunit